MRPWNTVGRHRALWIKYWEQVYGAPHKMKVPNKTLMKVCLTKGLKLVLKNSIRLEFSAKDLQKHT